MREFSQQAVDMASQFMGAGGGSGSRPGLGAFTPGAAGTRPALGEFKPMNGFPRGLNVGNMTNFAQTPAGRQLMGHIKGRVAPKRARIQI